MAELRFDITGDSGAAQRANRDYAATADIASRGARLLSDSIDKERRAKDASVAATLSLAKADKILADVEDELSGKAEEAAIALRAQAEEEKKAAREADRLAAAQSRIGSATEKLSGLSLFQPSKLALLPALIPVTAGLSQGLGAVAVSFSAAGAAAIGFGALVGTVLSTAGEQEQKLQALNMRLNAATTAAQKKAIRDQIKALESTWTPAFKKVIGQLQDFKDKWELLANQVAAPVVATWLGALTKSLQFIKPLVEPVALVFQSWGQSLNTYFASGKGSAEVTRLATAFGRFAGLQLGQIGGFIINIAKGVFDLGRDIAGSGANFYTFGNTLSSWGRAFASWASSAHARADVNKFVTYLHDNGSLIASVLKDVATTLPTLFAGANAAGTLELRVLADFLKWLTGLPAGWQKPLLDTAGALLLLSKTGVIKVGIQVVGKAAQLLTGGVFKLGGASAAAEMEAAFRTGGAAAAAEIRSAMAGGGAAGGAETAAGGAAAGGAAARAKTFLTGIFGSQAAIAAGAAAIVAGLFLRIKEDMKTGWASVAQDLPHWMGGIGGVISLSAQGWADAIVSRFEKPVRSSMAAFGKALLASVRTDWNDIVDSFHTFAHDFTSSFDAFRHAMAASWNALWADTKRIVSSGISAVVGFFKALPGKVLGALFGLGHSLYAFAHAALNEFLSGLKSVGGTVLRWLGGFAHSIIGVITKILHMSPPHPGSAFYDLGASMMHHLAAGIRASAHHAANAAKSAAGGVSGGSGALGGDAAANMRLARRMFPWPASMWPSFYALEMSEAGFNRFARNPSSGAYGIPQALPPTKMPFAAQAAGGSHAGAQLGWMFNYIASTYGNPVNAEAHEARFHWYDRGGLLMPGVTVAVNNTGRPEMVVPHGGGSKHVLVIKSGGSRMDNVIVDIIRQAVTEQGGGDVQVALGGSY